ncbi:MAG: hypothetical protein FJX42_12775, partial [Alphaproteobacteria bacterium]|nr:hypothetical protein [Alphaproteobacteria bacterium]
AIAEFARRIGAPGTVGLVFYSGHGIQAEGRNWLVPVDAALDSEDDLAAEAVDVQRILAAMDETRNPLNIVILDACRDNPLPRKSRSAARGLAVVSVAPRGSVIAYSASPNQKADDGAPGGNGVYTAELLRALDEPGLKLEEVFKRANAGVQRATSGRQVPWFTASIQGDFYFRPGAAMPAAVTAPLAPAPAAVALEPVEKEMIAQRAAVVRSRPDTGAERVTTLQAGMRVHVAGKVKGENWYAVEWDGKRIGYVFGELLTDQPIQQAAVTPPPAPPPSRDPQAQPAVGQFPSAPSPGTVFRDCPNCPEMVVIPAGSFVMGVAPGEEEREGVSDRLKGNSVPQHSVNVRSFMLGKYEVTVGEFGRFVNETGHRTDGGCVVPGKNEAEFDESKNWRNPGFGQGERHPVACVSWDDAKAYAAWLSRKTGKSYRLASEAEWEYAARAGTSTARHWGEDIGRNNANCDGCGSQWEDKSTAPIGSFRANAFGLHDMIGNVWEWTEDCWNENYNGAPVDGSAWTNGDCRHRVLRGGSWYFYLRDARSARRAKFPGVGRFDIGFRVARTN